MGYTFDFRGMDDLMTQLESSDEPTVRRALKTVNRITDDRMRLSLLEHAARHCGSSELATTAFTKMCDVLKAYPGEQKAGQVEDIIRYGSKVPAIRLLAMQYVVELVERGELNRHDPQAQEMLQFIAEVIRDKHSKVVVKARALLQNHGWN
jgi:hypothetical protein